MIEKKSALAFAFLRLLLAVGCKGAGSAPVLRLGMIPSTDPGKIVRESQPLVKYLDGQAVYNNVQLGFYSRLSTLILLIYALVLASGWISERVRVGIA